MSLADPLAGAVLLARQDLGDACDPGPLLSFWEKRSAGSPGTEMRYRWELSHRRGAPLPAFAGSPSSWKAPRPREQQQLERDPFAYEGHFLLPILLVDNLELLTRQAAAGDAVASSLLAEVAPIIRRDFAQFIQVQHPFHDTLALAYLTRRSHALASLHPLAIALATCYAAVSRDKGYVEGIRYPFAEHPLAGPSAQLAEGLLCLGLELDLVPRLVDFVRHKQLDSGGFSDDDDEGDPLTTLQCAALLASVDPTFSPEAPAAYLQKHRQPDGLFRALGPEAPWLTARIEAWLDHAARPFAERFRFPYLPAHSRDQKTGLPSYAYFAGLVSLFSALPGLSTAPVEIAFIDLAGFRVFNNTYGQDRGDDALRVFGQALATIPFACSIRDGGDEFLIIGAPGLGGLSSTINAFRSRWPAAFQAAFGADVPPVAPRVLVAQTTGARLLAARERLGRAITSLKHDVIDGPDGLQRELGPL